MIAIEVNKKIMKEFKITTEPLLLQNFLKLLDFTSTGGQAKYFLAEHEVKVNEEKETRRGRKLYAGDKVEVDKQEFLLTK